MINGKIVSRQLSLLFQKGIGLAGVVIEKLVMMDLAVGVVSFTNLVVQLLLNLLKSLQLLAMIGNQEVNCDKTGQELIGFLPANSLQPLAIIQFIQII